MDDREAAAKLRRIEEANRARQSKYMERLKSTGRRRAGYVLEPDALSRLAHWKDTTGVPKGQLISMAVMAFDSPPAEQRGGIVWRETGDTWTATDAAGFAGFVRRRSDGAFHAARPDLRDGVKDRPFDELETAQAWIAGRMEP